MIRALAALAVAVSLVFATDPASASVDSTTNCSNDGQFEIPGQGDGCIQIVGSGLHVDTLRAGVKHVRQGACSYYYVSKNGYIIHKSALRCVSYDNVDAINWGPTYTQNQNYPDGTQFCGWFGAWPDYRGCARVRP